MDASLVLLPILLPETTVTLPPVENTKSKGLKAKRKVWKPTVIEVMDAFVDVHQVSNIIVMSVVFVLILNKGWMVSIFSILMQNSN